MTSAPTEFTLIFDLQSYWHIGNGKEAGAYADALVRKDQGLPFIPGKSISGLLRDAFTIGEQNHWFAEVGDPQQLTFTNALFGLNKYDGSHSQGLLQLSSATLSDAEKHYFDDKSTAKSQLYRVLNSTAIGENGVAKNTSLRSIEVTVPLTLSAALSFNLSHPNFTKMQDKIGDQFTTWLNQALSLISELGAKRHRGLGKVSIHATAHTPIHIKAEA